MPYANDKGVDQPAHPRSLISTFVVRCLDSKIPVLANSKISRFQLASVAAQAGLSLAWSKTLKTRFLMTWLISGVPIFTVYTVDTCVDPLLSEAEGPQ